MCKVSQNAIVLMQAKIAEQKYKTPSQNRHTRLVASVATQLMDTHQCTTQTAVLAASRALAELEAPANCYINISDSTSYAIALNVQGIRLHIGIKQLVETFVTTPTQATL